MADNFVGNPYAYFNARNQGRPISNGQIFVGIPDLDPTIVANQKQLTAKQEDGTKVSIAQPVSTNSGGYSVDINGNIVVLLVDGNYAIRVNDSGGNLALEQSNVNDGIPLTADSGTISYDSLTEAVSDSGFSVGDRISTFSYKSKLERADLGVSYPDGGNAEYVVKTPEQAVLDGDLIDEIFNVSSGVNKVLVLIDSMTLENGGIVYGVFTAPVGNSNKTITEHAIEQASIKGKLSSGYGDAYITSEVVVYNATTTINITIDILATIVSPDNTSAVNIGNYDDCNIHFKGVRTLSDNPAASTTGVGFTKSTMRNCNLQVDLIRGFKDGFLSTSIDSDYYNHIDLGAIATNKTVGSCIHVDIDPAGFSNENIVTAKFLSGFDGITFRSIGVGERVDEYSGWKFTQIGFENITRTAYAPKTCARCVMDDPRLEGGSTPSDFWIDEDDTNTRNTYRISDDSDAALFRFEGNYATFYGLMNGAGGTGQIIWNKMIQDTELPAYEAFKKVASTAPRTHMWESDLVIDGDLWEKWAGFVTDDAGLFKPYGLLNPYKVSDLLSVEGDVQVPLSTSYIQTSTTGTGDLKLLMPADREINGLTMHMNLAFFTHNIEIAKASGTVTVASGVITGTGLYLLVYRGDVWKVSKIGDAVDG